MNIRLIGLMALIATGCDPADSDTEETADTVDIKDTGQPLDTVQVFEACEGQDFTITAPVEGYAWTPDAITLVSEQVADGIFAIYDANSEAYEPAGYPLATSSGFVVGEDGVLIVDTMINRQLLCQVVDLVREQTDKPVLYAVNTSYHGDHSYGNAFLPEGVQVVQHERTAEYIAEHFEEDVVFMETNFGADQGIDEVTPITPDIAVGDDGWTVDLGGITVEAQYHGFAQTEGDLFVYVAEAEVMWTGNPVVAAEPALPWLLDGHAHDVSATLATVQASLPAGAVVIPGHGRPSTRDIFSFPVDYLDTMTSEVQASVDGGADLESTQAAVVMEEFQGYALWDWVHTWVNVPMTHAELSE
ncbi:MAG: cyclase [Myxococcota bacterium]|jgi:cyclase